MIRILTLSAVLAAAGSPAFAAKVTFLNATGVKARVAYFSANEADAPIIPPQEPQYLDIGASWTSAAGLGRNIYHYTICGGGFCSHSSLALHDVKTDYVVRMALNGRLIGGTAAPDHWDDYFGRDPKPKPLSTVFDVVSFDEGRRRGPDAGLRGLGDALAACEGPSRWDCALSALARFSRK